MTTISDLNYVLGVLNANEYEYNEHRQAFECCKTEEERVALIASLTNRSNMAKAAEGVNKGTAPSVKATKAAAELAKASGIAIESVQPNAEGKIGVEEVQKAVENNG